VKKEERPKSPGLLAKLLAPFKGEKKVKAPKSPKKEKKKEVEAEVRVIPYRLSYLILILPFLGCCSCH